MSEPGGSSTINGVLFQLLGALEWGTAKLRQTPASDDITLILEPAGGGGDVQISTRSQLRVEQWKAKTGQGTWSLRQIIDDVLPDLFLGVKPAFFDSEVEFVFKTEGRQGLWEEAKKFFASLDGAVPAQHAPLNIDEQEPVRFFPEKDGLLTRRALFDQILSVVRKREAVRDEPINLSQRKLYFLLRRFRLESTPTVAELELQLEARLSELIDDIGDAKAKRREACSIMMELTAKGETTIRPAELLRKLRISGRAVRTPAAWTLTRNLLAARLDDQLETEEYNPQLEVRSVTSLVSHRAVTMIAGDSGVGKTWRLASAARAAIGQGIASIWTRATGDSAETLQNVAWEVWHFGLGHEAQLAWDAVEERLREAPVAAPEPILHVFIDNVQSAAEASALARFPWSRRRMRLVISTTPAIADSLCGAKATDPELSPLSDFTILQLRDYLRRRGHSWSNVPADIRDTLHRPILARLYCDLIATSAWQPHNEFELYSAYWHRIFRAAGQPEHPGDAAPLRRLARSALEPGAIYPWSAAGLDEAGVNDELRNRLEQIGWLRRIGQDAAEIWHDRLLNWASAEAVAEEWRTNASGLPTSIERLAQHAGHSPEFRPKRRLAYAAADFLWIILREREAERTPQLLPLLKQMEGGSPRSAVAEDLYRNVLPATGPGVVALLLARFEGTEPVYEKPDIGLLADALARCLDLNPSAQSYILNQLASAANQRRSDLLALVLARSPQSDWLDWLWSQHCRSLELIFGPKAQDHLESYRRSLRGLETAVSLAPQWLEEKFTQRELTPRQLGEAARLLCALPTETGLTLWEKFRPQLITRLTIGERRTLAKCIGRFRDASIKELRDWAVETENIVSQGRCLMALCCVDPDEVIGRLREIGIERFVFVQENAFGALFAQRPTATAAALFTWMTEKPADCWRIADFFFRVRPELISCEAVRFLLLQLESIVVEAASAEKADPHPLAYYARILMRFRAPAALAEFRGRAGSQLDLALGKFTIRVAGRPSGWFRENLDLFFLLLLRIGGDGLRFAVNGWLASDEPLQHGWADLSLLVADEDTRSLLRRRATSLAFVDSSPRKLPWDQAEAIVLLAALGENHAVIEAVIHWGEPVILMPLLDVRSRQPAMMDHDVAPAIAAIADTQPIERRTNAAYALGLSGRPQDAVHLIPLVQASGPANELVIAALHGLDLLEIKDPILVPHLRRWLSHPESAPQAAKLLITLGTPDAMDALEDSIQKREPPSSESFRWNVYGPLLRNSAHRERLLRQMWNFRPKDSDPWQWMQSPLTGLLPEFTDLGSPDVEAVLLQFAFPKAGPINNVGRAASAVQAIAKINPDEAFAMAEAKLFEATSDTDTWIGLITAIDAKRAPESLMRRAMHGGPTLVTWQIGAALRKLHQPEQVRALLKVHLHSGPTDKVVTAAELAGWQADDDLVDELNKMIAGPITGAVWGAVCRALRRLERERAARAIAIGMHNITEIDRWIAADAWCHLIEPLLLSSGFCPEDHAATLRLLPPLYFERINSGFQNRMQEFKRKAEDLDRNKKREAE